MSSADTSVHAQDSAGRSAAADDPARLRSSNISPAPSTPPIDARDTRSAASCTLDTLTLLCTPREPASRMCATLPRNFLSISHCALAGLRYTYRVGSGCRRKEETKVAHVVIELKDTSGRVVDRETYPIDTNGEIEAAKAAMREAGLVEADVFVGEGADEQKNGQKLFA